jgi:hypothetical protein
MSQENSTPVTLTELAQQEAIKRMRGPRPMSTDDRERQANMSPEEIERENTIMANRQRLRAVIQDFFGEAANRVSSPMLLLCVPDMIAHHNVLGSNAAMRLVLSEEPDNTEHVGEFLTVLSSALQYLPVRARLAQKLARNYNSHSRTLAECYWLYEMCSYLGIGNSFFGNMISQVLFSSDVKLEEIDFTKVLSAGTQAAVQTKEQILFDLTTQQYAELENLLSRM